MTPQELAQKLFDWFDEYADANGDYMAGDEPADVSIDIMGVDLEELAEAILQWVKT